MLFWTLFAPFSPLTQIRKQWLPSSIFGAAVEQTLALESQKAPTNLAAGCEVIDARSPPSPWHAARASDHDSWFS